VRRLFDFFKTQREKIITVFQKNIEDIRKNPAVNEEWRDEVCQKMLDFSKNGKMIRGGMVVLASYLFKGSVDQSTYDLAAVNELFHSAFLIQDDIMDRDRIRRGIPTISYQYAEKAAKAGYPDADHFGVSMGICFSDIVIFTAFKILGLIETRCPMHHSLTKLFVNEFIQVGLAQMQDVLNSHATDNVTEDEIMRLYLYKTARYTFSLPLMAGAMMTNQPDDVIENLSLIGEKLGLVFQIKDDEIGLFGDDAGIGKHVGSDIEEGKKTLYYLYLFQECSMEEKKELQGIFRKPGVNRQQIERVRNLVRHYAIDKRINETMAGLIRETKELIKTLPVVDEQYRDLLTSMADYSIKRRS
jgi:geranylgeranyl diphosphate synthase type I